MSPQGRHELTDGQWAKVKPVLPPQRPATGRPNHDHRTIINGILWRLKTGAPWRDLPERYGRWQTVYSRFRRYRRRRHIGAVIPRRGTEARRWVRCDAAYRERTAIARLINRLTPHREIATRYEQLEVSYHALLTIAAILLWL